MAGKRFIVAGSFIDGSGTDMRRNVYLEVKDGIITAIGSAAELTGKGGIAVDDFSHCTIVPALVDCSVFLSRSPSVDRSVQLAAQKADIDQKTKMLAQHICYCHAHGVLGVAENADISDLVEWYRNGEGQGCMIDIRIPGHVSFGRSNCVVDRPADGDFLKIYYTGNIEDEEEPHPRFGQEDLREILQHRGGRKAVVVVNGRQPVKEVLEAGCDAIEQGYGMGEDNLRRMAEKGVLWIPNVLRAKNSLDSSGSGGDVCCRFSTRYAAPGNALPGAEVFWKKMLSGQLTQLRLARQLGVVTAVGTGAGSVGILHGESMVEEMKLFIKAGYSREEAIRCASATGAGFFDLKELGTLTVGRKATFLIARGTVQQLPRKLSYLEGIYIDGAPSMAYSKNPVRTA